MGSGPSRSSSESHVSENGSAHNAPGSAGSKQSAKQQSERRRQGTENSKKEEPVGPSHTNQNSKLATQSTLSGKKESPLVKNRSEISHEGDESAPQMGGQNAHSLNQTETQLEASPSTSKPKKFILSSGLSLSAINSGGQSSEVLVKMGSSMLRTKNCSEEFQSLDLGEPVVMGKFDHDKSHLLHTLALERYCLVENSSISGFSSTLSSTTASASDNKQAPMPLAEQQGDSCLYRLSEGLPLYWLRANTASDMRHGAEQLKEAGFDRITVFICAADPVIFARQHEDKKSTDHHPSTIPKKSVFFCLPALVRAAPPSRSLQAPGRVTLSQLERDIKMSIVHLVAQEVGSGGTFPAYFGSTTTSQDIMSIGWTLGKISANFPDSINTAIGAAAEEFEVIRSRIYRVQTVAPSHTSDIPCIDESEINTISKAVMMDHYQYAPPEQPRNGSENGSPVFDENGPVNPKSALVVVTFEELTPDSSYILLLTAIAMTLQQQPTPTAYRKLFEEGVPPTGLNVVLKSFATQGCQLVEYFDDFITQIVSRLFKGGASCSTHFTSANRNNIVRYAYTFLFSYYCYDTYVRKSLTLTFSKWLRRHYLCYRSMAALSAPVTDIVELGLAQTSIHLIAENDGVPVMSVVSSDFGVRAHGFRKIPPAPVYGAQSPNVDELTAIVDYCVVFGKRWRHTVVVWCDLRPNPVIYLDGKPYLIADASGRSLADEKIASNGSDLEQVEEHFKANLWQSINPTFAKRSSGSLVPIEKKEPPRSILTPRDVASQLHLTPREANIESSSPKVALHDPHIAYYRLPTYDEKAPSEQVLQALVEIILSQQGMYSDEDGPAFLFTCASGVGAVTAMMIAATLVTYHLNGFPFGCHVGEEERVSIKNVQYTQGNFMAVRELIEQLPRGNQVKREVDAVLDACWDRMTSTFYHLREIIFATFSKVFTLHEEGTAANNNQTIDSVYGQSVDYLERYVLLIIFNSYLHTKKHEPGGWQSSTFQDWLSELADGDSPLIATLDNLCFQEFGDEHLAVKCRHIRSRWLRGTSLKKPLD